MDADARDSFGLVGARIDGKYLVESVVGEGGFGIVYRATHEGFDAPVAIKCLKIPASFDQPAQDRLVAQLREEGRVLLRLSQRTAGIVQALDVGTHTTPSGARVPYLVLEWLEGRTLADDLRARRRCIAPERTLSETLDLLEPAARALAIAHAERIAHRDIKPENLMIVGSGKSQTVKVLDFGIAKVLQEASSAQEAKTSGAAPMFTPGYAAPEQFEKSRGASGPWSDVFALALVFVEVASAKRALAPGELMDVYRATVDPDKRPTLRSLGFDAPKAVEAVIAKALHVEPRSRHADAGQLWDALSAAIRDAAAASSQPAASPDDASLDTAEFALRVEAGAKRQSATTAKEGKADREVASAPTERATTRGPLVASIMAQGDASPPPAKRWPLAVGALAALGLGGYLLLGRGQPVATPAQPTSSVSASSAPLASAAEATVVSSNPEAVTLFREAIEAWRGGSPDNAVSTLEQAVALDRGLAAGQLRLALWKLSRKPAEAREHYDSARHHAQTLGPKDAGLLDAVNPLMAVPEDGAGYEDKLAALAARFPGEAELWVLLAQVRVRRLRYAEALEATDKALALDPAHVGAWVYSGDAYAGKGDSDARLVAYRSCVQNVPRAFECLQKLVSLRGSLGQCPTMLADAKTFASVGAQSARAQRSLAIALQSTGADPTAVLEVLERSWGLLSKRERASIEPRDRASLAILAGDFEGALGFVQRWSEANAKEADQNAHLEPELVALDIERQLGRSAEAAARADGLRRKMSAWMEPNVGDWALTLDRYRLFAGKLSKEQFAAERDAWSERVRKKWQTGGRKTDGELNWTLWVTGHGNIATDEASARSAIEKLPPEVAALSTGRYASVDVVVGRAYALAGEHAAARPALERALGNCYFDLSDPVAATSGWYYLGLARELAGDKAGAKAAYERVVARWGKAKPASTTAALADKRLAALTP